MIEKLHNKKHFTLSRPCKDFIEVLKSYKNNALDSVSVAEIGVGIGATAIEIVKNLSPQDSYYFFSRKQDVDELYEDLKSLDYCQCKLFPVGNSKKTYDSYAWELSKILLNKYDGKSDIQFDLVYLDGAHTLFHDGLACAILKELIKPNGIIVFDDLTWTYASSPVVNPSVHPKTAELFTDEQINEAQIAMVIRLFMENDTKWEKIDLNNQCRVAYKKLM